MLLRLLGAALLMGCIAACPPLDGSGIPDAGTPLFVLESIPSTPITLVFGDEEELVVAVSDLEGEPAPGVRVTFLLEGTFHDSSLSKVTDISGSDGLVRTRLAAGYSNALFRVRVNAEDASPIHRLVAVSDGGFGTLEIEATYEGGREVDSYDVDVYFEAHCVDTRVADGAAGDREVLLPAGTSEASFEQLPATSLYAVTVTALNAAGAPIARGCVDEVALLADATQSIAIEAFDLPYGAAGSYEAT
ncbi:MAG: hypothetical protein H5U40_12520, partial [Polyangiaceae bacterium]|nr:hypothetical protein [Polyangiaceae bacterium]